jgi:hypothetical protein
MYEYSNELERTKAELDRRYDEVKSGTVELVDGEEAFRLLLQKAREQ